MPLNFRRILSGLIWLALACLAAPMALAEVAPAPAGGGYYAMPISTPEPGVQIFDDKVFNIDNPAAMTAPVSPGGRYMGSAPNYNTEQFAAWKRECAALRDRPAEYRRCFQQAKARSEAQVEERIQRESKQAGDALRGMSPLSPDILDSPSRVPSSNALPDDRVSGDESN